MYAMRKLAVIAAWCASLFAQAPAPSATELIARALARQKAQSERGTKYTYREEEAKADIDKNGKAGPVETRTYEHIMLAGSDYRKLILIEGKPLDEKTQKKVDADMEKARTERRKHRLLSFHRSVSFGGLNVVERLFDSKVVGEETIAERRTWRMESSPKAGYKPANPQEKADLASNRVTWFDQEDGDIVKETHLFVKAVDGFQPGPVFDIQFMKVGEDWLPDIFEFRIDVKAIPGIKMRADIHERFYDYKRFTVDSTVTTQ